MKVRVKLIATYIALFPAGTQGNTLEIDVPRGTRVTDVIARFGIPQDDSSVILVNGLTVALDSVLSNGDTVSAFSAIAGG